MEKGSKQVMLTTHNTTDFKVGYEGIYEAGGLQVLMKRPIYIKILHNDGYL